MGKSFIILILLVRENESGVNVGFWFFVCVCVLVIKRIGMRLTPEFCKIVNFFLEVYY